MTAADDRHRSAARSNYESTANIEKRQALQASITGFEGTPPQVLLAEVHSSDRVLDVGCGNGLWSAQLGQAGSVIGLDSSFAMACEAAVAAKVPTVHGDALHLPFATGSADAVLMFWMLYHVPEKVEAFSEVQRVLAPCGRLLATTNAPGEEGRHRDIFAAAVAEAIGSPVDHLLEPLDFHTDNAEALLLEFFDTVEVHRWAVAHTVSDPTLLVDYFDSHRDPVEAMLDRDLPWEEILAIARRNFAAEIDREGAIGFERRGAGFVARRRSARRSSS